MSAGLKTLIRRQDMHLADVLQELNVHKRKVGHWAWWVFPTEVEGASEPRLDGKKSSLTAEDVPGFLAYAERRGLWQKVLERIVDLAKQKGLDHVLMSADMGRVGFFLDFWERVPSIPPWLHTVLSQLAAFVGKPWRRRAAGEGAAAGPDEEDAELAAAIAASAAAASPEQPASAELKTLLEMGIEKERAKNALEAANGDLEMAIALAFDSKGGKRSRRSRRRRRSVRRSRRRSRNTRSIKRL